MYPVRYGADIDKVAEYWAEPGLCEKPDPLNRADANIDLFLHQVAIGADVLNSEFYNRATLLNSRGTDGWQDHVTWSPYAVARGETDGLPPSRLYDRFIRLDQKEPGTAIVEFFENSGVEPQVMYRFDVRTNAMGALLSRASSNMIVYGNSGPVIHRRVQKLDTLAGIFARWASGVVPPEAAENISKRDAIRRRADELNMAMANGRPAPRFAQRSYPAATAARLTAA